MLQQLFASLRALEELGLGKPALQAIPMAQRRRALKAASGFLAPMVRKRSQLPLVVELDPDELDASTMTGGATVAHTLVAAGTKAQDVSVKFTGAGAAPGALVPYSTNPYAGAFGSTFLAAGALDASGGLEIDGQRFTVTGTVAANDVFTFSMVVDPGIALTTTQIAAWILLHNRGLDPKTEADLQRQYEAAMAFAKALGAGDADLERLNDATPNRAELGPLGSGQRAPWEWLG